MAVPNVEPYHYSIRTDEMLADGDTGAFGQFDGAGPHQLTFTSTKKCCKATEYEFSKNGAPLLTGSTTLMNACAGAPCDPVECLGVLEPFKRNWNISTLNKETVFSFDITPGWLDSQIHAVKNQEGIEIGRIQQPSFVQRISDAWRNQLQVVVRVIDSKGYERFTLRRRGACGVPRCPYFKKVRRRTDQRTSATNQRCVVSFLLLTELRSKFYALPLSVAPFTSFCLSLLISAMVVGTSTSHSGSISTSPSMTAVTSGQHTRTHTQYDTVHLPVFVCSPFHPSCFVFGVVCPQCNGLCGQAEQQPCCKVISCRQCCEYRECDVCVRINTRHDGTQEPHRA